MSRLTGQSFYFVDFPTETQAGVAGVHPAEGRVPSGFAVLPPTQIICPECMEEFEADPLAFEYRCPRCGAVFYPGEDPVGTDLEDEI